MAHKKAAGSTRLGRDSQAKRLGIKIYGDQPATAGQVIVRQRGSQYHPGVNVRRAGDDTLYAMVDGLVHFRHRKVNEFTGKLVSRRFVDVIGEANHPELVEGLGASKDLAYTNHPEPTFAKAKEGQAAVEGLSVSQDSTKEVK